MIEKNLAAAAPEKGARSGRTFTRCCLSLWAGRCSSAATKAFRSGCCFKKLFVPSGGVSPLYFLRNYGALLIVGILCATPLPQKLYEKFKTNTLMRGLVLALILL